MINIIVKLNKRQTLTKFSSREPHPMFTEEFAGFSSKREWLTTIQWFSLDCCKVWLRHYTVVHRSSCIPTPRKGVYSYGEVYSLIALRQMYARSYTFCFHTHTDIRIPFTKSLFWSTSWHFTFTSLSPGPALHALLISSKNFMLGLFIAFLPSTTECSACQSLFEISRSALSFIFSLTSTLRLYTTFLTRYNIRFGYSRYAP